jgi:hypothetical protein
MQSWHHAPRFTAIVGAALTLLCLVLVTSSCVEVTNPPAPPS